MEIIRTDKGVIIAEHKVERRKHHEPFDIDAAFGLALPDESGEDLPCIYEAEAVHPKLGHDEEDYPVARIVELPDAIGLLDQWERTMLAKVTPDDMVSVSNVLKALNLTRRKLREISQQRP